MKNYRLYLTRLGRKLSEDVRGIRISDKAIVIQCFGCPIEGYAERGIEDIDTAITEIDELAKVVTRSRILS